MHTDYLSASRLTTYIDCDFRFFLQYHINIDELNEPKIASEKGSAVHQSLEDHVNGKDYEESLRNYYEASKLWALDNRKTGFTHPIEKNCNSCQWAIHNGGETICSIAGRDVASFDGCPKPHFEDDLKLVKATINRVDGPLSKKIIGAETPFDMEIEGVRVVGYIDLIIEENEQTLEVVDYKSGSYTKNYEDAFKDLQMRIYSIVAKRLFPQYNNVLMTLDYLRKQPITVCFSKEDDEKTAAYLKKAYDEIRANTNPQQVKSFRCNSWCIGFDKCSSIRQSYLDENGNFVLPPPVEKKSHRRLPTVGA